MDRFVVSLVGGVSLGGVYAVIGLGLVLVYRATETMNFAHGQFMLLPALIVGKWQTKNHMNFGVAFGLSVAIVGAVSAVFYRLVLRKTVGLPHFMPVIATFGLAAVLDGMMSLIFGSEQYNIRIPGLPRGVTTIFGARVDTTGLVLAVLTLCLASFVAAVLRLTALGRRVRAAGQDATLASQGGINVHRIFQGSWIAAAALAAIAGVSYGATNIVNPSLISLAFAAFPAILLGGLDSIEGALIGGVLVGILQGYTATYLGGEYTTVVTYLALVVVLLTMPQGIFGTRRTVRV
jgi:branched-chain amino acid transport system permease protein